MHFTGTVWRPPYEAASLPVEATGRLPEDRERLLSEIGRICRECGEAQLRLYRDTLPHL